MFFFISQDGHVNNPTVNANNADDERLLRGEKIKEAIKAIEVNGMSFFTLAVESGKEKAVKYAYDLTCFNFGQQSGEVTIKVHFKSRLMSARNAWRSPGS